MATQVDLKIGMNMEIGSVPLSLEVEYQTDDKGTTYTFDGCTQNATVPLAEFISFVGAQFGVDVVLPPELGLQAEIEYLVGQVVQVKPKTGATTTELGAAGRFVLSFADGKTYGFTFYADVLTGSDAASPPYVVGAAVDMELDFSELPVVGVIPGFNDLTLTDVGFSYTNQDPSAAEGDKVEFHIPQVSTSPNPLYTRNQADAANAESYSITSSGAQRKLALNKKGFALTAGFANNSTGENTDSFALPMALPPAPPPDPTPRPAPFYDGETSPAASSVHWIDINKVFGPVDLRKIGLNYASGEATFGLTANFTVGGFSLGLQALTITFPLPLPGQTAGNTVAFDLQGLTLDIKTSGLEIGGAFLKAESDGVVAYYGEVMVKAAAFSFKALGGYTPAHTSDGGQKIPASLFLYANIEVPLGGPPYLYVTGLAGGFGINNSLILPTLDELPTYILLPNNAPAPAGTAENTVTSILPQMQKYFLAEPGQYWIAAGVQFTSFEMIEAFVLVTVSFGVNFQVGVLGSCAMSFPSKQLSSGSSSAATIAYIEIDLIASFTPATGLLAVAGKLSPASYLFGDFCRLTGGFAFYVWFDGPHAGDFVVTLGGYHPDYVPPEWYPTVPRLGIDFQLGPLQVTGASYFALTPAMLMAGTSLTATWKIPAIRAWFTIGADFLIAWAPFHYEAHVYVSIGCSVDLGLFTLNLHAGADLKLWGPPFGGRAIVDLDIVSFTINFGSPQLPPPPIGWQAFRDGFLPSDGRSQTPSPLSESVMRRAAVANAALAAAVAAPTPAPAADAPEDDEGSNVVKANVTQGLVGQDVDGQDWVVDPQSFRIAITTTLPANAPEWAVSDSSRFDIPNDVSRYDVLPVDVTGGPYLVFDPDLVFSGTEVWNPTLAVRPMAEDDVTSTMTLTLLKRGASGSYDDYVTSVQARPVTGPVPAALWKAAPETPDPNEDSFVEGALTGFVLAPIPRDPDRVNAVPLLDLLFQAGNDTGFGWTGPAVDAGYTVKASLPQPSELDIAVSGGHDATLKNESWILSSLDDAWVESQRSSVLDELTAAGFSTYTPAEVDLTVMATQKALTDWPKVMLLGAHLAT